MTETNATTDRAAHMEALIRKYFDGLVSACVTSGPRRACLIANTAMELAPHDEEIAKWVKKRVEGIVGALENATANAVDAGEIHAHPKGSRAIAYYLMTTSCGLGVLAKAGASRKVLKDSADIALASLSSSS